MDAIRLTLEQLKRSKVFLAILFALPILALLPGFDLSAPIYLIVLEVMIASVISVHELLHVKKAEKMGYSVKVEVLALGNIRYDLKAPPHVIREVAKAPYYSPTPYLLELVFIALLLLIAINAKFPMKYFLEGITVLPVIHLTSMICAYLTLEGHKCERLAKLASSKDLEEANQPLTT